MTKLDAKEVTRTLTIVLPENEWQALRNVEPDAIGWLQGRIRERLGSSNAPSPEPAGRFEAILPAGFRELLGRRRVPRRRATRPSSIGA